MVIGTLALMIWRPTWGMVFGVTAAVRQLVWVGRLEGLSYILLLAVAMPLKYLAGEPRAVTIVGAAHGALFLAFLVALARAATEGDWPRRRVAWGLAASVIPLAVLWFERDLRRGDAADQSGNRRQ